MKILFVNNSKDFPGSAISLLNLFRGLTKRGVQILVVGPKMESHKFLDELQCLNIDYVVVNNPKNIWPKIRKESNRKIIVSYIQWPIKVVRLLFQSISSEKRISKIISKYHPDIIHSNSGVIHEGLKCARRSSIPHVFHLREYQDLDFGMKIYPSKKSFMRLLRRSYVITITEDILHHFHLDDYTKARVIYNGIYPRDKVKRHWPKQKTFLCCSRINESKGHEDVIRAFSRFSIENHDYKLVILGYGAEDYVLKLKELAASLGCEDKISWPGFVENPFDYMAQSMSLLVASRSEGFGRMTAEAAFAGTVVIGRNSGGTKEILTNTGGLLFDTNDGMYEAMCKVAHLSREEYERIVFGAQSFAIDHYSNESNIDNTYNFYLEILKERELHE